MKVEKYPAYFYTRDGEHITTLFASTPVSLVSQLKSIQRDEPCDTACMLVIVVTPWRTGVIRLWPTSYGDADRRFWYIDINDFHDLTGVKYVDAEEAYHDTVVR